MIYFCCDERRRQALLGHPTLNGIDFLEVVDDLAMPDADRQRTLLVNFVNPLTANSINKTRVRIEGGERIRDVAIESTSIGTGAQDHVLTVKVNHPGDFSTYTLRLVKNAKDLTNAQPPDGFDPQLSAIAFSFKVNCPSDFDCRTDQVCPPEPQAPPPIDYLAKDYASFRQLMLDRLSTLAPDWRERNPADLGIVLVELLAYVGDYLSYQQDAVATEAYLGTARRRVSVRRHARMVDYAMHDGCNARAWVQVQVLAKTELKRLAQSGSTTYTTKLLTRAPGQLASIAFDLFTEEQIQRQFRAQGVEIFEPLQDATLFPEHNQMNFYTWGARECCLPRGATRSTLAGLLPDLKVGDVLIFEEVLGPHTGEAEDADPSHRHAVRLTGVTLSKDPLGGRFLDPPNDDPVDVTEIEWAVADALPFPLCVSSQTDATHGDQQIDGVSVALGNVVLADHGMTISKESLGEVPEPKLARVQASAHCEHKPASTVFPRFTPRLRQRPLAQAATTTVVDPVTHQPRALPFDPNASAAAAFEWQMPAVLPAITLNDQTWHPSRDLLASDQFATEFVAEIEEDGVAALRFGDDQHGMRPAPGTNFDATYRVGNGPSGNIGAEAIVHIITHEPAIIAVRNPIPARGGVEPESIEHVRQSAPFAFRTQERAVTPADYAAVSERHPQVQRAAATFRWTGSWRTVFVTADRQGGLPVDDEFESAMRGHLERFRMAGHDLEIDGPRFVSLEVEMTVCVKPEYFRSSVKQALLTVFSNRALPDGRRGVFHPDNFTFGQPVFLSALYKAAQEVAGVDSVVITRLQRQGQFSPLALSTGKLELGRLEIARLDNDPNFAERGVLRLTLKGGK
ncbi:MAG: putative baseplate assembly protein [Acidobacteriota bacterium]